MARWVGGALAALALVCALEGRAEAGSRRVEKKAAKAAAAADRGDYKTAITVGLEVLDKDPGNLNAAWAVGSGAAMLLMQGGIADSEKETLTQGAVALLTVASHDPRNPVRAAMARGMLTDLTGSSFVLQRMEPSCPPAANSAYDQAEAAFGRGDMEGARGLYEQAIAACPANATWVVYMGDTWMNSDVSQAVVAYERALTIDPCHPQAHRFAADALMHSADVAGVARGYDHAMAAVACDPTYDEGWATLAVYVKATGKALVPRANASDDAEGYKVYTDALAKAVGDDALARREAAVREVFKQGAPDTPLWRTLLDASGKGLLEEAILFELLDEELSYVYLGQRATRLEQLKAYVSAEHVGR